MIEGWVVYNREDLKKNISFATMIREYGLKRGLNIKILERENICMGVCKEGLFIKAEGQERLPQFVINRTRDSLFAKQLELLKIKVFNTYEVTDLCNNKLKTHQFVNQLGIPSVNTFFFDGLYHTYEEVQLDFPIVVKTVDGHGGEEVYKVESKEELAKCIEDLGRRYLVLQEMCSQSGVDVRVFVVGNRPLAAIKREAKGDFRSNYSLGGSTSLFEIDETLQRLTKRILDNLRCDCVGIDFMIDKEGGYLFNEIEDVVGSRSLYQNSDLDIADIYIEHIKEKLG